MRLRILLQDLLLRCRRPVYGYLWWDSLMVSCHHDSLVLFAPRHGFCKHGVLQTSTRVLQENTRKQRSNMSVSWRNLSWEHLVQSWRCTGASDWQYGDLIHYSHYSNEQFVDMFIQFLHAMLACAGFYICDTHVIHLSWGCTLFYLNCLCVCKYKLGFL